jgi:hypothetical protein
VSRNGNTPIRFTATMNVPFAILLKPSPPPGARSYGDA